MLYRIISHLYTHWRDSHRQVKQCKRVLNSINQWRASCGLDCLAAIVARDCPPMGSWMLPGMPTRMPRGCCMSFNVAWGRTRIQEECFYSEEESTSKGISDNAMLWVDCQLSRSRLRFFAARHLRCKKSVIVHHYLLTGKCIADGWNSTVDHFATSPAHRIFAKRSNISARHDCIVQT